MVPFVATRRGPDNSVRWSVSGTVAGVRWANIFWSQLTTSATPTQAQLDTWLTTCSTAYKTQFASNIQGAVTFDQAQAQMFLAGGLVLPSLIAMTGAGSATSSNDIDAARCAVISWQTGVYWRGGKPRTYIPPGGTGQTDDQNSLSAATVTSFLTKAGLYLAAINAVTSGAITATQLGFVSFVSGGSDRPVPIFYPFIGAKVHPRLGTQRRRLGKWLP